MLSGEFADQAALYSVLARLEELGLDLVDVVVVGDDDWRRPRLYTARARLASSPAG